MLFLHADLGAALERRANQRVSILPIAPRRDFSLVGVPASISAENGVWVASLGGARGGRDCDARGP